VHATSLVACFPILVLSPGVRIQTLWKEFRRFSASQPALFGSVLPKFVITKGSSRLLCVSQGGTSFEINISRMNLYALFQVQEKPG
jgi:hypothetical protein